VATLPAATRNPFAPATATATAAAVVEQQRALAVRDTRLGAKEAQLREQAAQIAELEQAVRAAGDAAAAARRSHSDGQKRVDELTAAVQSCHARLDDAVRRLEGSAAAAAESATGHSEERADVERRVAAAADVLRREEAALRALLQERPNASATDRVTVARRRLDGLRRDVEERRAALAAGRAQLEEAERQRQDAQRAALRTHDERVAQAAVERRAALQQLAAHRDDRERQLRAAAEARHDEERARCAQLAEALIRIRDAEAREAQREVDLLAALAAAGEAIAAGASLQQRADAADAEQQRLQQQLRVAEDDAAVQRERVQALRAKVASYNAALAPLADVEASCRQLQEELAAAQLAAADRRAAHGHWRASQSERETAFSRAVDAARERGEAARRRRDALAASGATEAQEVKAQVAALEQQVRSSDAELAQVQRRNAELDARVAAAADEQRAHDDEMARRRETARKAAAQLLASLAE
jgi:chromosome segregation ATPase